MATERIASGPGLLRQRKVLQLIGWLTLLTEAGDETAPGLLAGLRHGMWAALWAGDTAALDEWGELLAPWLRATP